MARWLTRWLPAPARPRARGIRLSVEALEDRLTPYAVNLPDAPANPVHEDLTQDGFELFVRQFGKSDLNSMSDVITQLRTGARDEDNKNSEPFFDSSPSLRHFWNHDVAYNRTLSGGLGLGLESAPARALRILGLEGGIVSLFATDPDKAARYLGHVAHLLQDMTVPAHVHADPHYDGSSGTLPGGIISVTDFDPYHDYVDGVQFSTAGVFRVDSTYTASFDLAAGSRHQGFAAMADTDDGKGLRDPDQFPVFAGDRLVGLFAENAREAELYDTKDYVGRGNTSILFDRNRPIVVDTPTAVGIRQYFPAAAYSSFTQDELVAQATDLVPRAVRTTAELFRYFYSLSDTAAPTVDLPRLTSTDPANPQVIPGGRIDLEA
ncbi:MAG: hypothetical protein J0I06_06490, partial [Planctomycetes bacterium]|nr:hypothetical protein [Planctomycetota bacterium]